MERFYDWYNKMIQKKLLELLEEKEEESFMELFKVETNAAVEEALKIINHE